MRRGPLAVGALALVGALAATGCGIAEEAGERLEQEAQDQVDAAVDRAVEEAAERVGDELAEQGVVAEDEAQGLLQRGLDELEASGAVCSGYSAQAEAERREQMGSLLLAFWLAELETSAPPADVVGAFTADVDARCAAAPEASIASVAQESYVSGAFSPGSA